MKLRFGVFLIVVGLILSANTLPAKAFVVAHDYVSGASPCKVSNPHQITYFNVNYSFPYDLSLAAESWNDAPTFVHLSSTSDQSSATVQIIQIYDPTALDHIGLTFNAPDHRHLVCPGGIFSTPIYIQINRAAIDYYLSTYNPPSTPVNVEVHTLAHEFGHVLGLYESQVRCSLGYDNIYYSELCGVDFPVVDDIKGVAAIYGWTGDTAFAYDYPHYGINFGCGSNTLGPCTTPMSMVLQNPTGKGHLVQAYNSTSLPASNIAIIEAYVTPQTLYRFHTGWETGGGGANDTSARFATIQLDNDGFKFVSTATGVQTINSTAPTSGSTYFLELAVEWDNAQNQVHADAYVFQGSMQTGNGTETFLGHWGGYLGSAKWSDVTIVDSAVWTDSSSNPPSAYTVGNFWDFQSNPNKPLPWTPRLSEDSRGTPGYAGIPTQVVYKTWSPHDFISKVTMIWGDGYSDTQSFNNLNPYSPPGTQMQGMFQHTYPSAGTFAVTLTTFDSLNQATSDSWSITVEDFSLTLNPGSLIQYQGSCSGGKINGQTYGIFNVSLASLNSFSGTVQLSANVPNYPTTNSAGLSLSSSPSLPTSIALSPGASYILIVNLCASSNAPVFTPFKILITGSSGSLTHSAIVTLTVYPGGTGGCNPTHQINC